MVVVNFCELELLLKGFVNDGLVGLAVVVVDDGGVVNFTLIFSVTVVNGTFEVLVVVFVGNGRLVRVV